jgi:hypothetical protein
MPSTLSVLSFSSHKHSVCEVPTEAKVNEDTEKVPTQHGISLLSLGFDQFDDSITLSPLVTATTASTDSTMTIDALITTMAVQSALSECHPQRLSDHE